jgi:ubiquinone/menaquinone biosynthesis C-methylase UbiE
MTTKLSQATKTHYEDLIGRIGDDYIDYRWKRHPVSRSHYQHTKKAVEFAFNSLFCTVENLLEIGCGPGTWTDICLRHTKMMTIVDISSEMLKLVQERFAESPINYHCGDFISQQIQLPASFDVIFSARALEYMDNKRAMVEKSVALLKPGGQLVIITKNPAWLDKRRKTNSTDGNDIHCDWIAHQQLESFYIANGLVNVATFPVCLGSYYPPLNNRLAIKIFNLVQERVHRKKITGGIDFLAESYMTIGQKGGRKGRS